MGIAYFLTICTYLRVRMPLRGDLNGGPRGPPYPAPHLEVFWSEQSWDEMYQPFTEYSVDSQDLTLLKAVQTAQQ